LAPNLTFDSAAIPCTSPGKLTETQVVLARGDELAVDRYGFILAPEEARARAAAARCRRTKAQAKRDARAVAKWRKMLGCGREDFVAYMERRPAKVKRRVRKGIPDEFRGLVWQYLSGEAGAATLLGRGPVGRLAGRRHVEWRVVPVEAVRGSLAWWLVEIGLGVDGLHSTPSTPDPESYALPPTTCRPSPCPPLPCRAQAAAR
jgi:hypothetical protein